MTLFKLLRIVLLLSFLFVIVAGTWMTERQMASWDRPILVTVYPIIADDQSATRRYVKDIKASDFTDVNRFFEREFRPYGLKVTPAFRFQVTAPREDLPPAIPSQFDTVGIALWSLKMRWWSWLQDLDNDLVKPDIKMFLLYHSLNGNNELGISVGMRKGRYGVIKAFAKESIEDQNLIVFTHELLHVLGATDKYVISTGEPIYPHGYAEPHRDPLFPQPRAEIMGGRIPLNAYASVMPDSLEQCRIGRLTGEEIGFLAQLK